MNELEKALEQLNIKYEKNGKKYKIPTTKENLAELLKSYIAMTINLQSKIDKAIELGNKIIQEHEELVGLTGNLVLNFKQVLNILKEDK